MFFGLTIEKLLLVGLVAAFVVGPERLPRYASALADMTRKVRDWISSARERVREEMGDESIAIDWRTLDPLKYDPRRIVREALLEDVQPTRQPRAAESPKP